MTFSKSFLLEIMPGTCGSKRSLDPFAPAETLETDNFPKARILAKADHE
jgi:hypothetical protein